MKRITVDREWWGRMALWRTSAREGGTWIKEQRVVSKWEPYQDIPLARFKVFPLQMPWKHRTTEKGVTCVGLWESAG